MSQLTLNREQQAAVDNRDAACIVNANVGSGKTTVLVAKIRDLHERDGVAFRDMVVLTFTNKAADEIRTRMGDPTVGAMPSEQILMSAGTDAANGVGLSVTDGEFRCFGTFHGVCLGLLTDVLPVETLGYREGFTVIDPDAEMVLAQEIIEKEGLKIRYRNRLAKRLSQPKKDRYQDDLPRLKELLRAKKVERNEMTYDDLIANTLTLLTDSRIRSAVSGANCQPQDPAHSAQRAVFCPKWIIVDEVQDCDSSQLNLLWLMVKMSGAKLFAVGDPSQSIYGFRRGSANIFFRLKQVFHATELALPVNYRSDATILAAAKYFQQSGEPLEGVREASHKIRIRRHYDPVAEADDLAGRICELMEEGVKPQEIAIFYRLRSQSKVLEDVFRRNQIPYDVYPKEKAVSALEESSGDEEKMESGGGHQDSGADHQDTGEADAAGEEGQGVSAVGERSDELDRRSVSLMTLHASKGLEFRYVFIIGVNDGLIPLSRGMKKSEDPDEEEMRLFYVGITRAIEELELSYYMNPGFHGALPGEGRFLRMIPPKLTDHDEPEGPAVSLRDLTRMVREVQNRGAGRAETSTGNHQPEGSVESTDARRVKHPRYGEGTVVSEDEMMITVAFDDFGEKAFMKALSELEDI